MEDIKQKTILAILDGWGINPNTEGNAVLLARTPCLDGLQSKYPHTRLACSGEAVGLPKGVMGNSEVGHLNIGAGRVVYQDLLRIDRSIEDRTFFKNEVFKTLMRRIKNTGSTLHLLGLVSDGGVHSQLTHLLALIELAEEEGVENLCIHAILDGRDTPPDAGAGYIRRLQKFLKSRPFAAIGSICGRFYTMDRDKRWDRIETAYKLYTRGEGILEKDPVHAVLAAYERGETDEFVKPIVVQNEKTPHGSRLRDDDGILCFNFRADRVREITRALTDEAFPYFRRKDRPALSGFICLTQYDEAFSLPVAFTPVRMKSILGEQISRQGLKQLRIAETEKYAHVTYFFNGGEEKPFPQEDRCLIPSPRDIPTYDFKPEMSAVEVTNELISRIRKEEYDFIVLNYANMDMVGHTGVLEAAIQAVETVDQCLGQMIHSAKAHGYRVLVTADHGNAEKMVDSGNPYTSHTQHPVPLILVDDQMTNAKLREGCLGDIAPTILDLMGIQQPKEMTGTSLIL